MSSQLESLSEDVLIHIIFFLNPNELIALGKTSKVLYTISNDDLFWKGYHEKRLFEYSSFDALALLPKENVTIATFSSLVSGRPALCGNQQPRFKLLYNLYAKEKLRTTILYSLLDINDNGWTQVKLTELKQLLEKHFGGERAVKESTRFWNEKIKIYETFKGGPKYNYKAGYHVNSTLIQAAARLSFALLPMLAAFGAYDVLKIQPAFHDTRARGFAARLDSMLKSKANHEDIKKMCLELFFPKV